MSRQRRGRNCSFLDGPSEHISRKQSSGKGLHYVFGCQKIYFKPANVWLDIILQVEVRHMVNQKLNMNNSVYTP